VTMFQEAGSQWDLRILEHWPWVMLPVIIVAVFAFCAGLVLRVVGRKLFELIRWK
jgi:hypothetical protein